MNPTEILEPELVEVRGGFFIMGNDEGADDEKPAHEVWIDPLRFGKFTVTNQQYDLFLKTSSYPVLPLCRNQEAFNDPLQPVVGISWMDAAAYCLWLSEKTGRRY